MKLIKSTFMLLGLVMCLGACASECQIKLVDLSAELSQLEGVESVNKIKLLDPYSEEPIYRYSLLYQDGMLGILEQKHCVMSNLSASLLVGDDVESSLISSRLAKLLLVTPTWREKFAKQPIEKTILDGFMNQEKSGASESISLDDKIKLANENSEISLATADVSSIGFAYAKIVTFYLGVGGQ